MATLTSSGTVDVGDFILKYVIEGQGIPALVVGSSIYYPRTFSTSLKQHMQLIFMDHRGFAYAKKSFGASAYEFSVLIDDIERVRNTLNLKQIVIIGHSGHAYMALEYAKRYPHAVSHVVLIGCGPNQSMSSHQAATQYFESSVCPERKAKWEEDSAHLAKDIEAAPEQAFITFCKRFGARSWYNPYFDASPLWQGVSIHQVIFDKIWGQVFAELDITENLHYFEKPVFLALGKFDYLVAPFYTWESFRSAFKYLTLKLFEKSGHTPQLEEPEAFDKELLEWLGSFT